MIPRGESICRALGAACIVLALNTAEEHIANQVRLRENARHLSGGRRPPASLRAALPCAGTEGLSFRNPPRAPPVPERGLTFPPRCAASPESAGRGGACGGPAADAAECEGRPGPARGGAEGAAHEPGELEGEDGHTGPGGNARGGPRGGARRGGGAAEWAARSATGSRRTVRSTKRPPRRRGCSGSGRSSLSRPL